MIDAKAKDERYEIPFSEVQSFSGDMQDTPEPSGAKVN